MSNKKTRIPAAAELIDAVAGFLEQDLLPALEGSRSFNTRVSVNALRIIQRELTAPSPKTGHLKQLLGTTKTEDLESLLLLLAEKVRAGDIAEDDPTLLAVLREQALTRLAVDNPRYSSYVAARK